MIGLYKIFDAVRNKFCDLNENNDIQKLIINQVCKWNNAFYVYVNYIELRNVNFYQVIYYHPHLVYELK